MEEKLKRLKKTSELIEKYGGLKKTVPIVMELYDISFSAARRLYVEAQEAFGNLTHFNKQYHLDTYLHMVIDGANKAKHAGDFRSYSSLMDKYLAAIEKFMNSDEQDAYERLTIPDFAIGFFPETLKTKLPKNLEERIRKIKEEKNKLDAEDIEILEADTDEKNPL